MTKSFKNLWGRFLFRDRGILPTKRLLTIYLLFSVAVTLLASFGLSWVLIILLNILFIVFSFIDLFFSPKKHQLDFKRAIRHEMERGITYPVKIQIENRSNHPAIFKFVDDLPQSFKNSFPIKGTVKENDSTIVTYETIAPVRGRYQISKLYVRYTSPFKLWEKQVTPSLSHSIKVIPDLTETKHYLENAQQFLLADGVKIRKQKQGVGEFSKIRNYVVGDDPRKINWRQTAKLQEVMTNEYEPEHGKYITILIDCGRMMGAELTKGNRLEKVIEASITVAAAALQKGDYVSVLAFSKEVKAYVPPAKGNAHLQTILQAVYNLEVDAFESNYSAVFHYLQTVQTKRSLVLLFSDISTFLHEESGLIYLKRIRQKHLFLMIGIEDEGLAATAKIVPLTTNKAMVKSVAQQQIHSKKTEKNKWERQGLQMIEVREERLATAAVSHYIDIMNRGLL